MEHIEKNKSFYAYADKDGRIFNRRVCLLKPGTKVPGHTCIGNNRVLDFDGYFNIRDLVRLVEKRQIQAQSVRFNDIWHQLNGPGEKEWIMEKDPRFEAADIGFPGILAPIRNPENKALRMLDGRRRMWKQQASGAAEGMFYVIPEPDVYECFWMIISQQKMVALCSPSSEANRKPER